MIFSLRNSLFVVLTMAVQAGADLIDPTWDVANEREVVNSAESWWKKAQATGNPGIQYYGDGSWTFSEENWDGTEGGKGYIRIDVSRGTVSRTWIKTTIEGLPDAGACDTLQSLTMKFKGGDQIPLNDGFYVFVDGGYTGAYSSVSATYNRDPSSNPNELGGISFLDWNTKDPVVIPVRKSAGQSFEVAIAVEEEQEFGGFFEVEFEPTYSSNCGEATGDPHIKSWAGHWYDFHGICDLVFLRAESFANGLGLDIQIRTKGRYQYSFIESAAIKIGDDVLEVGSWGQYFFNGVESAKMPAIMGGLFPLTYSMQDQKRQHFEIDLGEGEAILVSTFKDIVSVAVKGATDNNFGSSVGLLGKFGNGSLVGRDGVTVMADDMDAFGQEWQVLPDEEQLFQTPSPFLGQACVPPTATKGRRLGQAISTEAAERACSDYEGDKKDRCIFDVIAMDDLEMAEVSGAY